MPKITVSVPDELLKEFKRKFPEINPAEIVRRAIIEKIEELEKFKSIVSKSKLAEKEVFELAEKISKDMHDNLKKRGLV